MFEVRRVCLYESCPTCGGKLFRYLLSGTYDSEEYGTTHGLQVWDRCEECKDVLRATNIALDTGSLRFQIGSLFNQWERREITDVDFKKGIQAAFHDAGGWGFLPKGETG